MVISRKSVTIVVPCFNEEENVVNIYQRLLKVFERDNSIDFRILFIDNASEDGTADLIRGICSNDKRVASIFNQRNFGYIRSTHHALNQVGTDAAVLVAADCQDPPELLLDFINHWKKGYKVVAGVKTNSEESRAIFLIRSFYYFLISKVAETKQIAHFTGFGLYDKEVIQQLRDANDRRLYLRGFVADLGYEIKVVEYEQPKRKKGKSNIRFFSLFDFAMTGMTSTGKTPIRLASYIGMCIAFLSIVISFATLIAKLLYWDSFNLGIAPILIGVFFLAGVQLTFLGIIGEYLAIVYTQVINRPLVIEKDRLNLESLSKEQKSSDQGRFSERSTHFIEKSLDEVGECSRHEMTKVSQEKIVIPN